MAESETRLIPRRSSPSSRRVDLGASDTPDVGFNITKIATDAVAARFADNLDVEILFLYNKTMRFLGNFNRTIRYAPLFSPMESMRAPWGEIQQMRMAAFPDAGF